MKSNSKLLIHELKVFDTIKIILAFILLHIYCIKVIMKEDELSLLHTIETQVCDWLIYQLQNNIFYAN